jgi:hypothetical protein
MTQPIVSKPEHDRTPMIAHATREQLGVAGEIMARRRSALRQLAKDA